MLKRPENTPSPKSIVIIPARLESSRLPRKVLLDIEGWPMVRHVYQRAMQAKLASEVLVATDSEEVATNVASWGGRVMMTGSDCTCGTERIASIAHRFDAEFVVNVQGDEPLIEPDLIDALIGTIQQSSADVVIPVRKIVSLDTLTSPTTVKAVVKDDSHVLTLSRSPVPFIRDVPLEEWLDLSNFWAVVGTAALKKEVLLEYQNWPETTLESLEKVEQLRFLEWGKRILAIETHLDSVAVDVPVDLDRVRQIVSSQRSTVGGARA